MKPKQLYTQLYNLFDKSTPIATDCGMLCGKACCNGDEECGMYLFPYEEVMYLNNTYAKSNTSVKKHDNIPSEALPSSSIKLSTCSFTYDNGKRNAVFAHCNGTCDRSVRPLACRIFPLFPYISASGNMEIITDPRAAYICPLARVLKLKDFDPQFIKNVNKCAKLLIRFDIIYNYLFELSRLIDDSQTL